MASVCLCFQIHQPYRLRRYSVFDTDHHYFDEYRNAELLRDLAARCYVPANRVLLDAIRLHEGRFRAAFSVSGAALEQLRLYVPEVVDGLGELARTGCVEFLGETFYHSLAFLYSREEFRRQVEAHRDLIKELFGQEPRVFRNTELVYDNDLAHFVSHMGYDAVVAEGADGVLGSRSPNHLYRPPHAANLKVLLNNYRLAEDVSRRFSDRAWEQWPVTPRKFAQWVNQINGNGEVCNLFLDYETLGVHQWSETGIFDFLRQLPGEVLTPPPANDFLTPGQAADAHAAVDELDVPKATSCGDDDRDLSPWLGNAMQTDACQELYKLEPVVKERNDPALLADWRRLTSSDHVRYMCTKYWGEGAADRQASPYESPYDSYINFMNVLDNLQARAKDNVA